MKCNILCTLFILEITDNNEGLLQKNFDALLLSLLLSLLLLLLLFLLLFVVVVAAVAAAAAAALFLDCVS